jgi:hypothetical protein
MSVLNGNASKFLVSVFGTVSTGLTAYYGTAKWEPAVLAGLAALLVYLVPNATAPAKAKPQLVRLVTDDSTAAPVQVVSTPPASGAAMPQ